jgi:hypothetical protein
MVEEKKTRLKSGQLKLDSILVDIIDKSLKISSWKAVQDFLNSPYTPWTLTHGDFWSRNDLVSIDLSSDPTIYMVD